MRINIPAASIAIIILSGCSAPLHLYPVHGPLADQGTASVITAKATGLASGTISFALPSGEACTGPWSPVLRGQMQNDLAPVWDAIYGPGFYVAKVLGSTWHGKAVITGNQGSVFQLEFFRDTVKDSPLLGVAKTQGGVIYKVAQ